MNRRKFIKLGCLCGAGLFLASYPLLIERRWVQVNSYKINVPGLPKSFEGYRIVHLTDIHLGLLVSLSFVRGVVQRANQLKADAIVCTGDYVHERNDTTQIDTVWPELMKLEAPDGVFSVLGNHDHWADEDRSKGWLQKSNQSVHHTCRPITRGKDRIVIGGSGDYLEDSLGIDKAFKATDEGDCRLLLTHNPDAVDSHFKTPIALVLAGHTHGGQVSVPFSGPPVLPVKNKRYNSGIIQTPKTRLFISRGIGWSIAPVRFNCYPEIALLTLSTTV